MISGIIFEANCFDGERKGAKYHQQNWYSGIKWKLKSFNTSKETKTIYLLAFWHVGKSVDFYLQHMGENDGRVWEEKK